MRIFLKESSTLLKKARRKFFLARKKLTRALHCVERPEITLFKIHERNDYCVSLYNVYSIRVREPHILTTMIIYFLQKCKRWEELLKSSSTAFFFLTLKNALRLKADLLWNTALSWNAFLIIKSEAIKRVYLLSNVWYFFKKVSKRAPFDTIICVKTNKRPVWHTFNPVCASVRSFDQRQEWASTLPRCSLKAIDASANELKHRGKKSFLSIKSARLKRFSK